MAEPLTVADPFDLPDWIGTSDCTWIANGSIAQVRVDGVLDPADGAVEGAKPLDLAVLATDVAYPRPVVDDALRHDVHQAWVHGQVLVLHEGAGVTLAVPGTELAVDTLCEALRRFARAVGATPERFTVTLQL